MKKLILALAITLTPLVAQAQTVCQSPCTVVPGEAFSFAVDHNGANTTSYNLYVNDALVGSLPAPAVSTGSVTFPFATGVPAGTAAGTYSLQATAVGPNGESVKTTPVQLVVQSVAQPPAAPFNPRITKP
jgi:hypothetical protein